MKYSSDWVGVMFSIRSGTIGMPLLTARSTSRPTCGDWLAWDEKTRTMTRDWWIASTIEAPYSAPGMTSRGAIQQRIPSDSSIAQAASAVGLSRVE